MATLYVENIPDELYKALRDRAREKRSSIAAEVVHLLEQGVVTPAELKARKAFLRQLAAVRAHTSVNNPTFPSAEEMQRVDRAR